jgi:hypothetical protein
MLRCFQVIEPAPGYAGPAGWMLRYIALTLLCVQDCRRESG